MPDRTRLVALDLRPGPELVESLDRLAAGGDAVLPLDPDAPPAVRSAQLNVLRPDALIGPGGREQRLADPLPTPAGTGAVVVTSGSTGAPKGVTLSSDALAASWEGAAERLGAEAGDRWLACLPAHHVAGLSVLWRSRLAGSAPVVHDGFDVAAIAADLPGVAFVSLVPTQLHRLLGAGVDLTGLKAVLLGGAHADASLLARARDIGVRVVTTYGMSETCGGCVYDGFPLTGVELRLDDGGIIGVRGPVLFSGYRGGGASDLDAEGWFDTADVGRIDAAGRLQVLGRADEVIVTGGEKVLPGPVEQLVAALPGVAEAAVVGREDAEWGQRVVAAIIPADPQAPPSLAAVRAAVRAELGSASAPKELLVVADLPRLATGKVDRLALRGAG